MKTLVVVNPMSAHGRTGREWSALAPRYERALGGDVTCHLTTAPGQAPHIVRKALAAGTERVVSIGGDGTNHEVVNGFFDPATRTAIREDAIFAFTAMGTGGDLARTFVAASELDAQLARIDQSPAERIDLIGCAYDSLDGGDWEISVNIASVGQGGDVCARVDDSPAKALGGGTPFLLASLESLVATRPWRVRLTVDDKPPREQAARNVIVANCRFHGGGMEVAPQASPDDGVLDLVVIGDLSRLAMLRMSRDIYRGRLQEHAGVSHEQMRKCKVELLPDERSMLLEMDGEARGFAPVTFEVMPSALRVAR
jgi:diacylglycerol kinase (ATP)